MPKISVVVPVYKVKDYIHRCVDSILNQTFSDFEIILVDDGSPDECGSICDEYAKKNSQIYAVHKENGGLSDARNYGFRYVQSEYVIFIDSDDYIENDMFEYMYTNIRKYDADMATCGAYDVFDDRIDQKSIVEDFVCSGRDAFGYILKGIHIRGEIWNKLIKTERIRGLNFPKGKLYEDIFFTAQMMQNIDKVCVGTQPKYYYVHRSDSITGKPYRAQIQDIIEAYENNYKIVCTSFPELEEIAECLKIWSRFIVLDKILMEKDYKCYPEYKAMKRYLCNNFGKILSNQYFHPFRKISALTLLFSNRLYRRMVLISFRKQTKIEG